MNSGKNGAYPFSWSEAHLKNAMLGCVMEKIVFFSCSLFVKAQQTKGPWEKFGLMPQERSRYFVSGEGLRRKTTDRLYICIGRAEILGKPGSQRREKIRWMTNQTMEVCLSE